MRLKNILLVVRDLERSKAFYSELFGMEVLGDFEGNAVLAGGLALQEQTRWEILTGRKTVYDGGDAELYFETYEMDSFIEKLEKSTFPIEYLRAAAGRDERVIRLYDPDRHVIEVAEKRSGKA